MLITPPLPLCMGSIVLGAAALGAQAPAAQPAFEVVSVKASAPASGPVPMRFGVPQPGGRWVATNAPLHIIIRSVYPGHDLDDQLVGAPDWVQSTRFDINARAAGDPPRDDIVAMARAMLADRFKLRVHTDTREVAGYSLIMAKADGKPGPSLKAPAVDCDAYRAERAKRGPEVNVAGREAPCTVMMVSGAGGSTKVIASGLALTGLATILSSSVGRPIVDATGLTGLFDIELEFAGQPDATPAAPASDTPSLITALQEQLGLRLEPRRVPVELLVVDHIERPTPD